MNGLSKTNERAAYNLVGKYIKHFYLTDYRYLFRAHKNHFSKNEKWFFVRFFVLRFKPFKTIFSALYPFCTVEPI